MTTSQADANPSTAFDNRLGGRARLGICLMLMLVSALPRMADLGRLSFFGDEETSGFPARSLARGEAAQVPSGMPYRRALPLSWLNAASAEMFGPTDESSYRLSSAVFGTLSVPALFLFGEAVAGAAIGGVAATALAGSEWHLAFSRVNRMYVPFLFFFIVAALFGWRWLKEGRLSDGVLFLITGAVSLSLHQLGVSLSLIPLIGLLLDDTRPGVIASLSAGAVLGLLAIVYNEGFVGAPYDRWKWAEASSGGSEYLRAFFRLLERPSLPPFWLAITSGAGGLTGIWGARRFHSHAAMEQGPRGWPFHAANYGLAVLAGGLAGAGQLYGFALFVALHGILLVRSPSRAWKATATSMLVMAALAVAVAAAGFGRHGLVGGLKAASTFPFPYPAYMLEQSPGFTLLLGAATIAGVCWGGSRSWPGLRMVTAFVLLFIGGLGMVSAWGPTRYYFPAYPFWLVAGAAALVGVVGAGLRKLGRPGAVRTTVAVSVGLLLVGATGGHGLPQVWKTVTLDHGEPTNPHLHGVSFRPDHRTPGRRLGELLVDEDVVIAEDPLQVAWYAGRADYWLRSFRDSRGFLRRTPEGQLRDIYVNSRLVTERDSLDAVVERAGGRAWLVTSGETAPNRDYYLGTAQRRWLDSVSANVEPTVRGEDGHTHLYCLNCPRDPGSGPDG